MLGDTSEGKPADVFILAKEDVMLGDSSNGSLPGIFIIVYLINNYSIICIIREYIYVLCLHNDQRK